MKVGDRNNVLNPGIDGIGSADPVDGVDAKRTAPSEDQVQVSRVARALARLIAHEVADAGGIRTEKVEPLRAAVARGEYRVDLQETARKFLREVLGDLVR